MARLTSEQKAQIIAYGDCGHKAKWIAKTMGLNPAPVAYHLLRAGIDPWDQARRTKNASQAGAFTPEEDARLLELAKTLGARRISIAMNRPKTSVVIRLMTLEARAEARMSHWPAEDGRAA